MWTWAPNADEPAASMREYPTPHARDTGMLASGGGAACTIGAPVRAAGSAHSSSMLSRRSGRHNRCLRLRVLVLYVVARAWRKARRSVARSRTSRTEAKMNEQPGWYFTAPWDPVPIRRGDALGFRAGADYFADLLA